IEDAPELAVDQLKPRRPALRSLVVRDERQRPLEVVDDRQELGNHILADHRRQLCPLLFGPPPVVRILGRSSLELVEITVALGPNRLELTRLALFALSTCVTLDALGLSGVDACPAGVFRTDVLSNRLLAIDALF